MSAGVVTAIIGAFAAVVVAAIAMVSARSVARSTAENSRRLADQEAAREREEHEREEARTRVQFEAQAYERARVSYERIVKDLEGQLERNQKTVERVQDQLDRMVSRLVEEQAINTGLRDQIHAMRQQIDELQRENEQFRRTIAEHQRISGALAADLRRAGAVLPATLALGLVVDAGEATRPAD